MTKSDDKRVPALRFKGFTDEWEQRKLGEHIIVSKQKNKDNLSLPAFSISNKNGFIPQEEQFGKDNTYSKTDKSSNYIVKPKYFAYNPARINVGSIAYQNTITPVLVSSLYEIFRSDNSIDDVFLQYWFRSEYFYKQIQRLQEGGVRQYFFIDKMRESQIYLTNVSEQNKIGSLISKLDNLLTLQQRKLKLLKLMKNIVSYNLVVSHKLASNNEIKWKAVYLKDIARIYQPTTITKKDLLPKGIPVFGANDYIGFYNKYNHETDQVTICARGASAGHPNYVKGPVWITGNSMVINVDETYINKKFLYTLLTFTDLKRFVTGGAQPQITRENLNSLKILLPSIKAQNNLSAIIENLSINIRKVQLSINSAKRLKQFLLQNMFI
ncbi:restriction endonuclease subunit S [Lactobacillus johnsonii]|uniref:restriction endonuclease subunit S n=1 Tax=Lactobacillus johnsonii TaxID=33959 RepID=UPI0011DDEDC0|nr:restriction endonuclease subunit S [Lactobacillus johnsonii]